MAATTAEHLQPQQQHQQRQYQQHKMSANCNINSNNMNRNLPPQPQTQQHNIQQQYNYNMQQQQMQKQMFQNSQDSTEIHMMTCQNYMTPMQQNNNQFMPNNDNTNTQHYQKHENNHHQQQHVENLSTDLIYGEISNNTRTSVDIPLNIEASLSTYQNTICPNQNNNNIGNMRQQHIYINNDNCMMIKQQQQQHFNEQQQFYLMQENQKQQQLQNNYYNNNNNTNNSNHQLTAKQHVEKKINRNANNTSCTTNLNSHFMDTTPTTTAIINGLETNGLQNNHSLLSGVKANIPPGWRRLSNSNSEIVYISPTGSTLRSAFQIKDYLLSPGTCKCGLPCPLQPEYFFDFNAEVPNTLATMPPYQSNEFDATTFYSSLTAAEQEPTSCSSQQSALMMSGAFVDTTSVSSSSSLVSPCYSPASTPSATSSSSLTCLHLKRFHDCQQLHANPMDFLTKDVKRRKIVNFESALDTTSSLSALVSPATTQTTTIYASDSGSGICGVQQENNPNSSWLPPLSPQQESQRQHDKYFSNHREEQQQYTPTNPTYHNNSTMESANKIWPKNEGILLEATVQHESHTTPPTHHIRMNGGNEDDHMQWSSNLCNKPQCVYQAKQNQQHRTMAPADTNTEEEYQQRLDDLNDYLQRQTTTLNNSSMGFETKIKDHFFSEKVGIENEEEDEEEDEEEEEEEQQRNYYFEEEENRRLKEREILNISNSLADLMTKPEISTNNDEDFNKKQETTEGVDDDNEDTTDALEDEYNEEGNSEEEEENDLESNADSWQQSPMENNSSNNSIHVYQEPHSQSQNIKQQLHVSTIQNDLSPTQTQLTNKLPLTATGINNSEQNIFKQHESQQSQRLKDPSKLVATAQESPVSSSSDLHHKTSDNTKKPEQVEAITTSNKSPEPCLLSPASSIEATCSKVLNSKPAPSTITVLHLKPQQLRPTVKKPTSEQVHVLRHIRNAGHIPHQPQKLAATNTSPATVTTIAGNRDAATTTTTTSSSAQRTISSTSPQTPNQKLSSVTQKATTSIPVQLQPLLRCGDNTGNSQIIMTSTGQLIMMSSTNNKPHAQQQQQRVIIASGNAITTTQSPVTKNIFIKQQDISNNAQQLTTATLQQQSNGSFILSHSKNAQSTAAQLQPATIVLNSGQNLITNNSKSLTSNDNIINATATNQLPSTLTKTSQQTMLLNSLPTGGDVIQQQQPHTEQTTVEKQQQQFAITNGQVVQHLVQQSDGRLVITSAEDPKRTTKKRKNLPTPTISNGTTNCMQISPTLSNRTAMHLQEGITSLQVALQPAQTTTQPHVIQLATAPAANAATTATYPQQFQLGNGIQGIVVNKPAANTTTAQPQQILLQNGQIIQPMNLVGQQLILPTNLVIAPNANLLQTQNVGAYRPTTNLLTTTPQRTMWLTTTSPQINKQFIQPATAGQQYIVGGNGQLNPIGQIYSTPMGLVMPASTQQISTATATFVQRNCTAIQLQPLHHQQVTTTPQYITLHALQQHSQNLTQQQHHVVQSQVGIVLETAATSTTSPNSHITSPRIPPDTTTYSPQSPERPPSHRSVGSDMVQCVSSSEPDGGTISPLSSGSRQSPTTTVCDKGNVMTTAYKPTEARIHRRVQTPPKRNVIDTDGATHGVEK